MIITVISDTHIKENNKLLPIEVIESIKQTDLLIHAGDFISTTLLNYLEDITKVIGVAGNNDGPEIIIKLGKKKIVELNGFRIGIIHGESFYGSAIDTAKKAFLDENVDIVIFGHSHNPYQEIWDGVLYFNPGSPTDKRSNINYSYGELTLGEEIKAEIFYL